MRQKEILIIINIFKSSSADYSPISILANFKQNFISWYGMKEETTIFKCFKNPFSHVAQYLMYVVKKINFALNIVAKITEIS